MKLFTLSDRMYENEEDYAAEDEDSEEISNDIWQESSAYTYSLKTRQ